MQSAKENNDTSFLHLFIKHVDVAVHRRVLRNGRVVIVGVVNSYDKLRHNSPMKNEKSRKLGFLSMMMSSVVSAVIVCVFCIGGSNTWLFKRFSLTHILESARARS